MLQLHKEVMIVQCGSNCVKNNCKTLDDDWGGCCFIDGGDYLGE